MATTNLTVQEIKQKLLDRKRRMNRLNLSLPDLEELDGLLAIQELTAKDVEDAQALGKDNNGEVSETAALGVLVARALVLYDTKERIFNDIEGSHIASSFGVLLLLPLGEAVKEFSGVNSAAMEEIRKNLKRIPGSDSATSSAEK